MQSLQRGHMQLCPSASALTCKPSCSRALGRNSMPASCAYDSTRSRSGGVRAAVRCSGLGQGKIEAGVEQCWVRNR